MPPGCGERVAKPGAFAAGPPPLELARWSVSSMQSSGSFLIFL